MVFVKPVLLLVTLSLVSGQHYGGQDGGGLQQRAIQPQSDPYSNYNRQPPPQILSHKQALNHDGNFKYLFTSENGLAQGESIAPDGSRNGGYSYTDPNGRKISVKYTAGKEGFRILEADHLPKAPLPVAPVPIPQHAGGGISQGYNQGYNLPHDDGQYRPEIYEQPQQAAPQYYNQGPPAYTAPLLKQIPQAAPSSNAIEREPIYDDAPGKPHSFGSGYIFEFGG